jgi:hypothetical protein
MSRRWFLLLGLVVVLAAAAAAVAWYGRPKKNTVTLEVTGKTGTPFKGTAEVDGSTQELTGTVPAQFVLEGTRLTYSLASPEESGEIRVKALLGGVALGSAGSGDPPKNGVRGWVKSGWGWSAPEHWIESFDRDGDPKWLKPPPP